MKPREKFLLYILLWPIICTSAQQSLPIKQAKVRCFESNKKTNWFSNTQREDLLENTSKAYENSVILLQSFDRVRERANKLIVDIQSRTTDWRKARITVHAQENQIRALYVRDNRITRGRRQVNGFSVYSTDIQPMATYPRNSRITRETIRANLFSVRSKENQLMITGTDNSRIMRKTTRGSRLAVRSRDIQQMTTYARESRITKVNLFLVRSTNNRLISTDVQNSQIKRETTRNNRFSVPSKETHLMKADTEDSRIMREAAKDRRFPERSKDVQQMIAYARNGRIERETTRVDRFAVRSMDNRRTSADVQDSRIVRETTRNNRFSVPSKENQLTTADTEGSRVMRETARDRRFNVRLRDIQQIKTCARDDRIARETTRVDRFSVRSMDNRLMSRDVQDSRTARETTRKNRFSVRSTGIQQMVSNARVSRQARETTKLNRFLIRATDVQLIAKDVPEGKSRQKARMNHLSVHLTDKQRLITDLKGGQMTRVNDFVNLKGHRKILSGKNQDEVRVRNRSANQFTMNLNDIQTKILLWNGDVSLSRERSRSVSRLATHVMRLQSEIQGWKDSEIFVRRMETRIANSIPVDTRNFQQRMTIALKYNRVTRMQRTGRLYTLPETLRDLSRSAAVGGKDKNHFQTNAERATSQSSRKAWSKNTCESQNNRRQGRQIPLKNIARRRIVALNSISRANKNVDVFQGLDKTLLIRNKHHFRQLDSRAILKGDVLQIIRNRQQFRSHGDRLKKEFVRITPKDDKIYENADNKHTNNYSASGKTLIKTKNSEKDNTELSPFRNAEELKWVAEHRHTLKRNHRTFRSVGLDGKYNTGKMKFSRSVKLEIQDQNRRDFVRSTELPRFKNHRNRADIKEHFKSISSCDSEIKNKNYEANRRTLTQSRRNNEHKKRENELLGDSGHSSDIDVRKLNSHRSLTVRTNQSQIVSEDMSSVLYSAQLYFLSGSIKPLKREYSGTVRDKFTIGRLNKASWSDSLRNIRLTEKNWKIVRRRNEYFNCRRDNEISRVRNSEERISSLNVPIQAAVDTLNDPYVRSLKNMPMQDTRRRHMSSRVLEIEKKPETLELIRTAGANDVHYTWHVRMTFWNSIRVLLNVVLGLGAILLACDAQEKKCAPSVFGDCWRFMASTSF